MAATEVIRIIIAIVISYLLGSIPSAYIAGRLVKKVDIRQVGGRNAGALNTAREIGLAAGLAVLIADIVKGSLAVLIAQWLGFSLTFVLLAGFAAVVGHNWPVFLKFRGGKGTATTLGVLLALAPLELAIGLAIIFIVILATSNVTLGVTIALTLLPLIIWQFGGANSLIFYSMALALFLGLRYIPTVKRGWASTSSKRDFIIDKQYKPWQKKKVDMSK